MEMNIGSAAITGASGMIGSLIANELVSNGWTVRILTRSRINRFPSNITVIQGDINNCYKLGCLLKGVDAIFHCAAELSDEEKMYSTNVEGTRNILRLALKTKASYFCYISSAGVIGPTITPFVTEDTICLPNNLYENTKYEAELLVKNSRLAMSTCILRPTNIIDGSNIGVLSLPILGGWKEKLMVYLKGQECAHIIYSKDVANAALFFLKNQFPGPNIYFVSIDDDSRNTVGNIYNIYNEICNKKERITVFMPKYVPYLLRKIYKGDRLHGRVRFSSEKIKNKGFVFMYPVISTLKEIHRLRIG